MVTMSPFFTWLISWASTASTSSEVMRCSRPALTATSALFLLAPVAKAFGSGELKTPTSGMPIPASRDCRRTVSTSHCSDWLAGCSMICTPMARLAVHLDMASEIKEPPKPMMADKSSSAFRSRSTPFSCRMPSNPKI